MTSHNTHVSHGNLCLHKKIQIRLRHQCLHWHVHGWKTNELSAVGELSPWLGQKQDAALYRQQSLKSSWHMENIMVVSHSSCSTSSENYPISLTHYSHHFNSLRTAEHSVPILLPSAIITKELLLKKRSSNWSEWCYRAPKQRLSVLDAFPLCLFGRAELELETSHETTTFDSHKKLWADVLWRPWFLSVCRLFHTRPCGRGQSVFHRKSCVKVLTGSQWRSSNNVVQFTCNMPDQFWIRSWIL